MGRHPIASAIDDLIADLNAVRDECPQILQRADEALVSAKADWDELHKVLKMSEASPPPSPLGHDMPPAKHTRVLRAKRVRDSARRMSNHTGSLLLLGMVSDFDAFVGRLVRAVFELRSEVKRQVQGKIDIRDLEGISTVDEVVELLLEKEVDRVLRLSHVRQLEWFDTHSDVRFQASPAHPSFVEVTERRNLIAHTGGIVTKQYRGSCAAAKAQPSATDAVGSVEAATNRQYLDHAYNTLFEVGVTVSQGVWRHLRPDQLADADKDLTSICYVLLVFERWELVGRLLRFALAIPHSSEYERRKFVVNYAQSKKWAGDDLDCHNILDAEDWTDADDSFHLARAVLLDDFERAEC